MISNESDSSATENLTSSSAGGGSSKANYWRSISELRGEAEFNEYLDREFPVAASEFPEGVSRRRWMQLMGASLAVAGAAGCRYPKETIEPFVIRPEGRVPGENYERATNFELAGRVYNLLVTCVDGRPLKVEPNKAHPSGAGTDAYAQASVLQLYDPDRARGDDGFLLRKSRLKEDNGRRFEVDWSEFDPVGRSVVEASGDGAGFAVLLGPTSSPSLVRMVNALKERLPQATVCQYDGVAGDVMGRATKAAFGKQSRQVLDLEQAEVIVALQAHILGTDRSMLSNAVGFGKRRDPGPDNKAGMNRLYVV
ncbi:MAG TPA: molybdopterin oxidoreductase, partial [Rhodopirellula sp.]|nr:molybdopterin oxidoreductase [Rhodopirellula sp.]